MPDKTEQDWESYFTDMKGTKYEKIVQWYRLNIIAPSHKKFFEKAFPDDKGVYVEVGSGTAQASQLINKGCKTLIALDISSDALKQSKSIRQFDARIKADAFFLPFKDNSLSGIWNHGLFEHFEEKDIHRIMAECSRALKPGAGFYTFWPPMYSLNGTVLRIISVFAGLFGKNIEFYPGEITRPWSRSSLCRIAEPHFSDVKAYFPARNLWGDFVLVCRK